MSLWSRFKKWLRPTKHDFDMTLPGMELEWVFTCRHCGLQLKSMQEAYRLLGRKCEEI